MPVCSLMKRTSARRETTTLPGVPSSPTMRRCGVVELYAAIVFGDDGGVGGCTTGDTTGVERTEGELRTGFTDGLGGNDADGFALLYHLGGGEVAAVALLADAVLGFAGEDGTDFDFFDAGFRWQRRWVGDFLAGVDEDVSVFGWAMSCTETRPRMRSERELTISSPFLSAEQTRPRRVPQSSSLMMTSCETSTRRRVRYPASAVFKAVSARPLRAPWVAVKYSRTLRPSR